MRDSFIKKIVLPSGPVNNDNFVAMAILSKTDGSNLAYCKNDDQSRTFIADVRRSYCDLTYYNKQFYAVDEKEAIVVCDVNGTSPSVSVVEPPTQDIFAILYLINLGDDELLLVARYLGPEFEYYEVDEPPEIYFMTDGFNVFRMNWSGPQWEKVESLGDWMLFVGKNSEVSLIASDVRRCLRNPKYLNPGSFHGGFLEDCIYYSDDYRESDYDGAYGSDTGIYRLWDEKTFSLPCCAGTPYSLWVTPNVGSCRVSQVSSMLCLFVSTRRVISMNVN